MNWNSYFEMMRDWKKLPAYRAEPRVDSIVGYYMPEFASEFLNDKVVGMIPELPLRLATLDNNKSGDKSFKVDFYLLGATGNHYLVEFKTDSASIRANQYKYLDQSKTAGIEAIINGIVQISGVSIYKDKYSHLLSKLRSLGLIDEHGMYSGIKSTLKVVYIQPGVSNCKSTVDAVIGFERIAEWLLRRYGNNDFEKALAETLIKWAE